MKRVKLVTLSIFVSLQILSSNARAQGFEKPILWSGRYAGIANAVSSVVRSPEALILNPAGLAETKSAAVFDLSPVYVVSHAPIVQDNVTVDATPRLVPVGAGFAAHQMSDRMGIGLGASGIGGAGGSYGNISFSPSAAPLIRTILTLIELSLGVGYRVTDELNIGAAYRVTVYSAEASNAGGGVSSVITGLTGTNYGGYRLGVQYQPKSKTWGLGAVYRSRIALDFTGGTQIISNIATNPTSGLGTSNDASLTTSSPYAIFLGGYYRLPSLLFALQYEYYNYSENQTQTLHSTALTQAGTPGGTQIIQLGWKNLQFVRAGLQYDWIEEHPIRIGYIYGTQVTPNDRATYAYTSPGPTNTITLGTGGKLSENWTWDSALDYSFIAGDGTSNPPNLAGSYAFKDYTFHLGLERAL